MTERHSSGVIPLDDASSADLLSRVLEAARVPGALVVFDLDSTLLDNRPRQARILREYGVDHEVPLLADSRAEHWDGWDPRVAMRATGLAEASVESHHAPFRAYWHERFFTSAYCLDDVPLPGVVPYLEAVVATGATLLYVTGRHEEMRAGTIACFRRHGMPVPGPQSIRLVMKPTLDEHDDAYKARTYHELGALGHVVAAFDNEPTHINGYRTAFPDAIVIHLATDHSPRPIAVAPGILSIHDFRAHRS